MGQPSQGGGGAGAGDGKRARPKRGLASPTVRPARGQQHDKSSSPVAQAMSPRRGHRQFRGPARTLSGRRAQAKHGQRDTTTGKPPSGSRARSGESRLASQAGDRKTIGAQCVRLRPERALCCWQARVQWLGKLEPRAPSLEPSRRPQQQGANLFLQWPTALTKGP